MDGDQKIKRGEEPLRAMRQTCLARGLAPLGTPQEFTETRH